MSATAPYRSIEPPPSGMTREAFVARFGGLFEHSPWIAERLWDRGLAPEHDTIAGLHAALAAVGAAASEDEKLALIRAHPDLAGRAAVRGELTADSACEQAGAGLDQCTEQEFARLQELNAAYREKFGFPFVIAVKGLDRSGILAAFERRIANAPEDEFAEALRQIDRIALLRLEALAAG